MKWSDNAGTGRAHEDYVRISHPTVIETISTVTSAGN